MLIQLCLNICLIGVHRDIASAIKELLDTVNNVFKKYQYQNRRVSDNTHTHTLSLLDRCSQYTVSLTEGRNKNGFVFSRLLSIRRKSLWNTQKASATLWKRTSKTESMEVLRIAHYSHCRSLFFLFLFSI